MTCRHSYATNLQIVKHILISHIYNQRKCSFLIIISLIQAKNLSNTARPFVTEPSERGQILHSSFYPAHFCLSFASKGLCLSQPEHKHELSGQRTVVDLNNAIASTSDHQASGWVHVHVGDVVLPLVERCQWSSTAPHTHTHTMTALY